MKPSPTWRLPDLIDYESFLNADERAPAEELHRRDRAFYLSAPDSDHEKPRSLLRRWLDFRRGLARREHTGPEVILPGEAFSQVYSLTRWSLILGGLLIGWAAAAAALAYSANAEPINAFTFFVEFAVAQAAILLLAFAVLAARHWFPDRPIPSLMRLALRVAAGVARGLWRRHRVRIAGARRQNAEALFGVLRSRRALYGAAFGWSLVILGQGFAISFNAGVLGAMAARHAFHDLDFGWESTWFDAPQISRGVEIAATPWAWALKPGHPSPAQVAGSQNRKRGAARLDAESLKSWSHFLFGAVICYGLLPRIALLAFASRGQRRSLERLRFGDGRSAMVLNRLHTPTVQTLGLPTAEPEVASVVVPIQETPPPPETADVASVEGAASAVVINLTGRPFSPAQAATAVGSADAAVFEAGSLALEDDERTFAAVRSRGSDSPVAALVASWTAPMVASKLLLDQLRASVGRETLIRLVLIGRPAPDGAYRPVRDSDRALWTSAANARGDAYLMVQ